MSERPIIVFDVNETLLDLDAIRPVFDRVFGDPAAMRLWFAHLITYSEALTLAGVYVPFTDTGGAVLRMLATSRGAAISDSDAAQLTDRFATMPPHPEVPEALRRLHDHGFRLFTLTGNTLAISGRQLERAGVIDLFERRFSVDESVRRHKPAQEAYHSVAAALGVAPENTCLIACHVLDTIGRGRLAVGPHPARGQRTAGRRPAAGLHRQGPRRDRRPAHRALPGGGQRRLTSLLQARGCIGRWRRPAEISTDQKGPRLRRQAQRPGPKRARRTSPAADAPVGCRSDTQETSAIKRPHRDTRRLGTQGLSRQPSWPCAFPRW